MTGDEASWQERRSHAAAEQAAALQRRAAAEAKQAHALTREFAQAALRRGLKTERLNVRSYGGRRYRTQIEGWYVRRNQSLGVDTSGNFYVLNVPSSLRSWLRGAVVQPADPPLEVGRGARDGETMPLDQLLHQRLEAGDGWR